MSETAQSPVNALAARYETEVLARARALDPQAFAMRTMSYGSDPAQVIDLFLPVKGSRPGVLVFMHGGGFTHGGPAWNHFMVPLARRAGLALASVGYRLLPVGQDGAMQLDDMAAALALLSRDSAELGVDGRRIIVGGHSAGAALAAGIALRPDLLGGAGVPVGCLRGVLCLSASLHRPAITGTPGADYALPAGPLRISPDAPLAWLDQAHVPMMIAWGGRERQRARVERSSMAMIGALADRGVAAEWLFDAAADHFDTHLNAADPDHPWFARIADWLERMTAPN